jgi:hypothetical protein
MIINVGSFLVKSHVSNTPKKSAAQKPDGSNPKNEEIPSAGALGRQSAPQIGCGGLSFPLFSPSTTPRSVANIYPVRPIVEMCMDWSGGIAMTFLGTG